MRPVLAAVLATTVLATTITPAAAGGPPGSVEPNLPEPPAQTTTKRYGTQVFLADLAVFAAVALVSSAEDDGGGDGGDGGDGDGGSGVGALVSLGYFAAAPLVHLHYGNPSGARKSLAARALLPVGGAVVGMALVGAGTDSSSEEGGGFEIVIGMVLGATVGAVSAMVLDWTVFSKKTVEVKPSGYAVAPSVGVSKQGVSVGLAGRF